MRITLYVANGPVTFEADEILRMRGVDDTMRLAYQEISQTLYRSDRITDFRMAAFLVSLRKVMRT